MILVITDAILHRNKKTKNKNHEKLSLLLIVITIGASSFAKTNNMDITTVKKIATDGIVTSIKIYDNVEVVLTNNEVNEIQIVGEKKGVEKILLRSATGN